MQGEFCEYSLPFGNLGLYRNAFAYSSQIKLLHTILLQAIGIFLMDIELLTKFYTTYFYV